MTRHTEKPAPLWSELEPDGKYLLYEGDNPEAFVAEMKAKYDFDPSKEDREQMLEYWCPSRRPGDYHKCPTWERDHCFFCPGWLLDLIYGNGAYPLGS
jgi:hypothetical protein